MYEHKSWMIPWMIICSGLGGLLYGYDIGVISGALFGIRDSIPMTSYEAGFIVGAVLFGSFFAMLVTGFFADHYGRKPSMIAACLIFLTGLLFVITAHSFTVLLLARILLGFGIGVISVAIPLYLSEVTPARIRGLGITVFQLFLTFGILLAYFIDLYFLKTNSWRAMFSILFIPAIFLFLNIIVLPESPRWLMVKNKKELALSILKKIRHSKNVMDEFHCIQNNINETQHNKTNLFSKKLMGPVLLCLFIAISNQLTGINSILQYAPTIFKASGFATQSHSMQATTLIGLLNFCVTLIGLFLIDRVGRRRLLLIGTTILFLSDFALASIPHFAFLMGMQKTLSLAFLLLWITGFAMGPGIVVWIILGELVPTAVRGKNIAICLSVNTLTSSALATFFLPLIHKFGMHDVFWLLGFFTLLYAVVCGIYLPETKGKALEHIVFSEG